MERSLPSHYWAPNRAKDGAREPRRLFDPGGESGFGPRLSKEMFAGRLLSAKGLSKWAWTAFPSRFVFRRPEGDFTAELPRSQNVGASPPRNFATGGGAVRT